MKLVSISYSEYPHGSRKWVLDKFDLNDVNLIVGRNAEGKSRTISVIAGLGLLMTNPNSVIDNGNYYVEFEKDGNIISYELGIFSKNIIKEELAINGDLKLTRRPLGLGEMYNVEADKFLKFQIPLNVPAITRRDKIQYPYLEDLFEWATNVRFFQFGSELGKNHFIITNTADQIKEYDLKQTNTVIELFYQGSIKYKDAFKQAIINDLKMIGYDLESISYGKQHSINLAGNKIGDITGLLIKESGRNFTTDQISISAGMFRALAVIIYFNYYEISKKPGTVLIDDIGEGLDFDRSTKLIKLITDKASKNEIQLVMTTNDQFVMNNTPIEYWQILNRTGGMVKIYNHLNSTQNFDDFKYTGLNNFDFFTTGFFKEGFSDEETILHD